MGSDPAPSHLHNSSRRLQADTEDIQVRQEVRILVVGEWESVPKEWLKTHDLLEGIFDKRGGDEECKEWQFGHKGPITLRFSYVGDDFHIKLQRTNNQITNVNFPSIKEQERCLIGSTHGTPLVPRDSSTPTTNTSNSPSLSNSARLNDRDALVIDARLLDQDVFATYAKLFDQGVIAIVSMHDVD
ncbi:hypothetical protein Fot_37473 [Forsythia ovata]|uniref:Uncharacterized protein n=1 Tax=Forsythia ovata TaxID=205694 RepID=A0ABD1RZ31_9LAMI